MTGATTAGPFQSAPQKNCPHCGEVILAAAMKCKHCKSWLNTPTPAPSSWASHSNTTTPAFVAAPMAFSDAVRTCLTKYATFSGRARRAEYWYFYLFTVLAGFGTSFIGALVGTVLFRANGGSMNDGVMVGNVFYFITVLAFAIPTFAVYVRRLHDVDRSGWWWLLLFTIVGIIPLIYWICSEGTKGENRYGPRTT